MSRTPDWGAKAFRWALWLAVSVVAGLLVGFAIGLAKPRKRG